MKPKFGWRSRFQAELYWISPVDPKIRWIIRYKYTEFADDADNSRMMRIIRGMIADDSRIIRG